MIQDLHLTRRAVLSGAAGVAVLAGSSVPAVAVPLGSRRARFLSDGELATLRGVVDRVIPGPPEDTVPGAVDGGCHEAIDSLLAAFTVSPPLIYAGGPFSDRGGARHNDFAEFLPLDRYERDAWRLRIEGSRGRRQWERNGAVPGYQRTYRRGLRALARAVPGFADLPGPARDAALRTTQDARIQDMVDLAVTHTLEFLYGAPEYGGNRDLVGWRTSGFDGDVQPRGYTDDEVENPELSPHGDVLTDLLGDARPAAALATTESVHGLLARSGGRFGALQQELSRLTATPDELRRMNELAQALADEARAGER